jgi:hypothetical protein
MKNDEKEKDSFNTADDPSLKSPCYKNCLQLLWHLVFVVVTCLIAGLTFHFTDAAAYADEPSSSGLNSAFTRGGLLQVPQVASALAANYRGFKSISGQAGVRIVAFVFFILSEFPKITVFGIFQNRWYYLLHDTSVRRKVIVAKLVIKQCKQVFGESKAFNGMKRYLITF